METPDPTNAKGDVTRFHRSRRLGLVILALVVLGAGITTLASSLGGSKPPSAARPTIPASSPTVPTTTTATWASTRHGAAEAIWPQQTIAEARAAQSFVDAGDPTFAWQLDSQEVVLRFVRQQLGWPRAFASSLGQPSGVHQRAYDVSTCAPAVAGCSIDPHTSRATITLKPLGKDGGGSIWVITEVADPSLAMNLWPPFEVPDGGFLIGFTLTEERSLVTAGYVLGRPCGSRLEAVNLVVPKDRYRVDFTANLSAPGSSCPSGTSAGLPASGYLFLMSPGGLSGTPFDQRTGGYAVIRFTALPVTFVPSLGATATSGPHLVLPNEPEGRLDRHGVDTFRVQTDLPDGTRADYYTFSKDLEGDGFVTVQRGVLELPIANNACREVNGILIGTKVKVRLTVAPVFSFGSCPPPGFAGCGYVPQPPGVLAFLGRHFERAAGSQVQRYGLDNWIVATRTYQLPAASCTAKFVGGNQIQITPGG